MKIKLSFLFLNLLVLIFVIISCSEENKNEGIVLEYGPLITMDSLHIKSEIGDFIEISGKAEANKGLKSIIIECEQLSIFEEILFDDGQAVQEYTFESKYILTQNVLEDEFIITITCIDNTGDFVTRKLLLTVVRDKTPPEFIATPEQYIRKIAHEEVHVPIAFELNDNRGLETVFIKVPELNICKEIKIEEDNNLYFFYEDVLILPPIVGNYNIEIQAIDKNSNTREWISEISIEDLIDFEKMYLTDNLTIEELNKNIFGSPMLIDHKGNYTYETQYYSAKEGTEIFFIPQRKDFKPFCFGVDVRDESLLTEDPYFSKPIILPEKGYYAISFNTLTGKYIIKPYSPKDDPLDIGGDIPLNPNDPNNNETIPLEIGLVGSGIPGKPSWATADPLLFIQDTSNKYQHFVDMNLSEGISLQVIIHHKHPEGKWDYMFWRFDNGNDPQKTIYKGGNNSNVRIPKSGNYRFVFDSHLNRAKLYLLDL